MTKRNKKLLALGAYCVIQAAVSMILTNQQKKSSDFAEEKKVLAKWVPSYLQLLHEVLTNFKNILPLKKKNLSLRDNTYFCPIFVLYS